MLLRRTVAETADATGAASFTFDTVPDNRVWTGAVVCGNAPVFSRFTATTANTQWGSWTGPQPGVQVQINQGETLSVTALGLTAGQQYQLALLGTDDQIGQAPQFVPSSPSTFMPSAVGECFVFPFSAVASDAGTITTGIVSSDVFGWTLTGASDGASSPPAVIQLVDSGTGVAFADVTIPQGGSRTVVGGPGATSLPVTGPVVVRYSGMGANKSRVSGAIYYSNAQQVPVSAAKRLYIGDTTDNTVVVIDTGTNAVVATIPLGGKPTSMATTPDGSTLVVQTLVPTAVIIDTVALVVRHTVSLGDGNTVGASSANGYSVNVTTSEIDPVDLASGTPGSTIPVTLYGEQAPARSAPDGTNVYYMAQQLLGSITDLYKLDTASNTPALVAHLNGTLAALPGVTAVFGVLDIAVSPDGTLIWVCAALETSGSPVTAVVSVTPGGTIGTPLLLTTLQLGTAIAVSTDGTTVWVGDTSGNITSVVAGVQGAVITDPHGAVEQYGMATTATAVYVCDGLAVQVIEGGVIAEALTPSTAPTLALTAAIP